MSKTSTILTVAIAFGIIACEERVAIRTKSVAISEERWAREMEQEVEEIFEQVEQEQESSAEEGEPPAPFVRKVAVCIDTSGSISGLDLASFVQYIGDTFASEEDEEVHLIIGDTEVDWQGPYEGPKTFADGSDAYLAAVWQGRGGTDFRELIQAGEDAKPHVILYLTDGFGILPQDPPNVPMIWILNRQCWTGSDGTIYDPNCKELRRFGEIASLQDLSSPTP